MSEHPRAFVCVSHSPFMGLPGRESFGPAYREAIGGAKTFLRDFDPELVVMFAPDHMNLLQEVRPPFTAVLSGRTKAEFHVPELELAVPGEIAAAFCRRLVDSDVDVAVAEQVEVDHGLGLTLTQLFDAPAQVPIVPVIVNAIGFPLAPMRRSIAFGAAVAKALADLPERVVFIGTGGLSHNPPFPAPVPGARRLDPAQRKQSLQSALDYLDPAWDEALLRRMAQPDSDWFEALSQDEIDKRGCGANEVRVWAAAWAACGFPRATTTAYEAVPEWITGMGVAYGRSVTGRAEPSELTQLAAG